MQEYKPIITPLNANANAKLLNECEQYEVEMQDVPYKQVVGPWMYAIVGI